MDTARSAEVRLAALSQEWGATGDHRAVFADCYLIMTRQVEDAVRTDRFHDGVWVSRLLDRFAGYYFDAVDSYGGVAGLSVCPTTDQVQRDVVGHWAPWPRGSTC